MLHPTQLPSQVKGFRNRPCSHTSSLDAQSHLLSLSHNIKQRSAHLVKAFPNAIQTEKVQLLHKRKVQLCSRHRSGSWLSFTRPQLPIPSTRIFKTPTHHHFVFQPLISSDITITQHQKQVRAVCTAFYNADQARPAEFLHISLV